MRPLPAAGCRVAWDASRTVRCGHPFSVHLRQMDDRDDDGVGVSAVDAVIRFRTGGAAYAEGAR